MLPDWNWTHEFELLFREEVFEEDSVEDMTKWDMARGEVVQKGELEGAGGKRIPVCDSRRGEQVVDRHREETLGEKLARGGTSDN